MKKSTTTTTTKSRKETLLWALLLCSVWIVLLLMNTLPPKDSFFYLTDFNLNTAGKYMAYAILALGIDLLWGYTGILSLGQGIFFGLGAYCMGMHLMLSIGGEGAYQSELPDFMVWNQLEALPFFWKPFDSFVFSMLAVVFVPGFFAFVFGFLTFRSRIKGVYFSIITQALALTVWLLFNQNTMNLGGTNGLTDFKSILGFSLGEASTQRMLFVATGVCLVLAFLLCRYITQSRLGKVLIAIRDNEGRIRFSGYSASQYKLFVFVISAALAGIAGALYVPQVGIITPGQIGVLPSIEMIVWVAVGGRGTLIGAILGAVGVNWARSFLTSNYPDLWLYFLGALFVGVVLYFPKGMWEVSARIKALFLRRFKKQGFVEH
ncbi:MAG: urea ABC transporter permease subunit UrtC [Nitrospirota bacterium]|nr:urea ABC transporter permease subunit UrtC [Nitrospirota bacterium]